MSDSNLASATVKAMKNWSRKPADFYPTPYEATIALNKVDMPPPGSIIGEPACGDGAMSRVLSALGYEVVSADLRRTGYGQHGVDFTRLRPRIDTQFDEVDAIITNPPFSVAASFIRTAISKAPYVAMLLKSNYWHTKDRLKLYRDHPPSGVYPLTWRLAFLQDERGKSPLMDCTWFVWRDGPLRHEPLPKPALISGIGTPGLTVASVKLEDALEELTEVFDAARNVR